MRLLAAATLIGLAACAQAAEAIVVAQRGSYTIAGLASHADVAPRFRFGIALFPGHPGILRLREAGGEPQYELRGNFLVRSRRHWHDGETMVLVLDAPSDEWHSFEQTFRARPRYGEDVAALLREVSARYGVEDWTFVGTSEGSVSAFHAARMNQDLAKRLVLTASVFRATRNGPGLSSAAWSELRIPLLWVHHEDDPCEFTSYNDARYFSGRTRSPLLTVRGGGPGKGGACQAFTAHGFVGVERETVLAMRSWARTGAVPPDVGEAPRSR